MDAIFSSEVGTSRDRAMDVYHSDALERGIPRRNMVSLKGSLAVDQIVSVELVTDNSSEGATDV